MLSHAGLRRRGRIDHFGRDESRYLEPLERIINSGRTPAEEMLAKFHGPWNGSVEPAYDGICFLNRIHLGFRRFLEAGRNESRSARSAPFIRAYMFVAIKWRRADGGVSGNSKAINSMSGAACSGRVW